MIGTADGPAVPLPAEVTSASGLSDKQLAALLQQHLGLDATLELAAAEAGCSGTTNGNGLVMAGARQAATPLSQREVKGPNPQGQLAVDEFVAQVRQAGRTGVHCISVSHICLLQPSNSVRACIV